MRAAGRLALTLALVPALAAGTALAQEAPPVPAPPAPAVGPAVPDPAVPDPAAAVTAVPEDPNPEGGPPLVAIDPGHGGGDTGAIGQIPAGTVTGLPARGAIGGKLYEKDVNLDIARRLNDILVARGYPTLMTRTIDKGAGDEPYRSERADLRARVAMANAAGADLFVSIHANAAPPSFHGTETYRFYSTGTAGMLLARSIHEEVVFRNGLADRGVKSAGFYVLKYTSMPAVLLESGFVTNRDEAQLLAQPDFREKIAEGLGAGIDRYVREGGPVEAGETVAPEPVPIRFWVTAGVFRRAADARERAAAAREAGFAALVRGRASARLKRNLYYVVTGRFSLIENARAQRDDLREAGFPGKVGAAKPPAAAAA
ncbi:MAG: N-acetylmuramoyl-L-alanine amidase [Miltoncostaeaceae bacterium]|nr:N-acetylmuramoyl-L-alanine amidase [Miltoncostaeaceae bacterium]